MDTQWPRYEVFEQERPDQPHRNAGAVHAPDPELALQNARDVFVRRPECHSLWVAPASEVFSRTAEELAAEPTLGQPSAAGAPSSETYLVFVKQSQRQAGTFVVHAGQVEARSAQEALRLAVQEFGAEAVYVWWVVAARAVTRSVPADAEALFDPARHKEYRLPSTYQVSRQMRAATAGPSTGSNAPTGDEEP